MIQYQIKLGEIMKKVNELDLKTSLYNDVTYNSLIGVIKTIIILWVISVIMIVGAFLLYLNQYDFTSTETITTETYTQDGAGLNNINIGTQGDVGNGTDIY